MAQRLVLITPIQFAAQPKAPPEGAGPPPAAGAPAPSVPLPYFATVTFLEGGAPDLPSGPVDPGWGVRPPVDPGFGIPVRPPHVGNRPPWAPVRPDHGLPGAPEIDNSLPIPWPPPDPDAPPGTIWPPLEPEGPGKPPGGGGKPPGYILIWVPGYGYRWVKVGDDKPEGPSKPPGGSKPPETAQPKR